MHFDDSRGPRALSIPLSAPEPIARAQALTVRLAGGYLVSSEGNRISAVEDGLDPRLAIIDRYHAEVCLAVRPDEVHDLRPGRYAGTLLVVGGVNEATLASLPVELTFRASRWNGIAFAVLGVLLGLTVKVLSEAAAGQRASGVGARRALRMYASELTFPVTLILAAIAGWLVFVQSYGVDSDWGSAGDIDAAKLFAACFIVQLGSIGAIDLVRHVAGASPTVQPSPSTSG
jgi:hypothetical protein